MRKHCSIKHRNDSKLPSLHKESSKVLLKKNQSLSKIFIEEKLLTPIKEYPKNIEQIKAQNFLNQTMTLASPQLIMNMSDCVKKEYGKRFEATKQFSQQNLLKKNFIKHFAYQKENNPVKSFYVGSLTQSSFYQTQKKPSFERQQILNLAKWIDDKLENFNSKKQISVHEIVEYKQHILNYGLGKIIDSIRKKSRQEGDLLQILWDNSFKIFEKILEIISNSIFEKEKNHLVEENETKNIFDMNLQFLKRQNQKVNHELNNIYEKMKKVIIWNKRLRKQKKNLNVSNRILSYRNQTYTQALEETISMFLRAVPQSSTMNYAKKIIEKLAIQKRRKKKKFQRKEVDDDFKTEAKQLVLSWLRRNGFNQIQDEQIDPLIHLTNDEKLQLTRIDDQNRTNQIDIFEYFKLLDIGVQTDNQTRNASCQYDLDTKVKTASKGVFTDTICKKNFEIQVGNNESVSFNQSSLRKTPGSKRTSTIIRKNEKKKSNISKFSQKSDKFSKDRSENRKKTRQNVLSNQNFEDEKYSKFSKNGLRGNGKQLGKGFQRKDEDKQGSNKRYVNHITNESFDEQKDIRFYEKDFTIISEKKTEEFIFDSDEEIKNQQSDKYRVSISKLNGESKFNRCDTLKYEQGQTMRGRQVSIKDFTQIGGHDEQVLPWDIDPNNLKQLWKYLHNKKVNENQKRDSRLSMNFIKIDSQNYSMKKLEKKLFSQLYEQQKKNLNNQQKQREDLFQTVVRRRSFYKKGKVMFDNTHDFEESRETKSNLYKSYIHYKPRKDTNLVQISQEEEQKVDQISKKMAIPSNLAKSKTLDASKEMFKQLSETCKKTKKQPPKNKQYFNASLVSITKNVRALIQDYIRQIKRQKDEIQNDFQKTYYPLHTILMDKMNWKYGLKDISGKKIKDFIEKILIFAPVSQKVSLYSLLFGLQLEGVGADELLIYLKCFVYLQKKQPISSSIHILKENNIFEKVSTDKEIVEENIDRILKEFFDKEGAELTKKEIVQYLQLNLKHLSIEKISDIIIRSFLKRKQAFKKDCLYLYKICNKGNNVFTNMFKILRVFKDYSHMVGNKQNGKKSEINISLILKEFIKRSDVIDEIYGKSISFDRFLTAYMVTQLPKESQFESLFEFILLTFNQKRMQSDKMKKVKSNNLKQNISTFNQQNVRFLEQIQKRWQIKVVEKPQQETWKWNVSKTVTEHVQNNIKNILGKLGAVNNQIENFFFSFQSKTDNSLLKNSE